MNEAGKMAATWLRLAAIQFLACSADNDRVVCISTKDKINET